MASLSLVNVNKVYPNGYHAVRDFNMEIADKEFIIFVGPSGCGKSTTLRMIAGLEDISSGEFKIDGKLMNDVEPKDRDIAMVFQNYALYPHMTVYDNMAFGLKLRKVPKDEIDKAVRDAAKILDLSHLLDRKPKALSGGQRQRVAMGRAIYVTHDQTEAMTLGTRIVVMKDGIVQQIDSPQNLYDNPANLFVAGFMGSPQMNFIDAVAEVAGGKAYLKVADQKIELPADKAKAIIDGGYNGKTVILGIRPENIIETSGQAPYNFNSTVNVYELLGAEVFLYFELEGANITARVEPTTKVRPGDKVTFTFDTKKIHIFDKETEVTIVN